MKYLQEFEQINKYIKVLLKPLCRSDNGFLNINKQVFHITYKEYSLSFVSIYIDLLFIKEELK